jgi:hypothetical protein
VNEHKSGVAEFGLDVEGMVTSAWRVFISRPLTLLGVSCLIQILWFPAHLFGLPAIFWLPFVICVPYATVHILRGESSDRMFLGWIRHYPRLLVIFIPAALVFVVLYILCVFMQIFVAQLFANDLSTRVAMMLYWGRFFIPIMIESILGHMLALAAILSVRKKLSATDAILELFSTRRQFLEVFLLASTLALFGMSGGIICCVGIFATTTFSMICLGVAYYQLFEQ